MKFVTTVEEANRLGYNFVGLITIQELGKLILKQQYSHIYNNASYIMGSFESIFHKDRDDVYVSIKNRFANRKEYSGVMLYNHMRDVQENVGDVIFIHMDFPELNKDNNDMDF